MTPASRVLASLEYSLSWSEAQELFSFTLLNLVLYECSSLNWQLKVYRAQLHCDDVMIISVPGMYTLKVRGHILFH